MNPPPDLAVLLLLQFFLALPPLVHATTVTAIVASQVDTAPLQVDHPQRTVEVSTSSATASLCGEQHDVLLCPSEEKPHHTVDEGDGDVAARGGDQDVHATKGQPKSDATSSSHHFPRMNSGKPQTFEEIATEDDGDYTYRYFYADEDGPEKHSAADKRVAATTSATQGQRKREEDDYDYDYVDVYDEYDRNAEALRKKVALEQMTEGENPLTMEQMKHSRGCHQLPKAGRPLYTEEDWQRLRQIYKDQGGGTIQFQGDAPADYVLPMRPGHTSDGKGRGVFATRDIKRGEMTYGGINNYAFFTDGPSYRRFVEALSVYEACDVMMWTWLQNTPWQKVILLVLDDNALQNSGAGDEANTGAHPEDHSPWGIFDEFAHKDIREGEELLCDYDRFLGDFWDDFGL